MSTANGGNTKKKRKVSNASDAKVKVEPADDGGIAIAPPDYSDLSTVQTLLFVDLAKEDEGSIIEALESLSDLTEGEDASEENSEEIHEAGGASTIAALMRKWYSSTAILAEACYLVINVSRREEDFCYSLRKAGGLDTILWALKTFPDDQELQLAACGVLRNLFQQDNGSMDHAVKKNCIALIVTAMNKFRDDYELQRCASSALKALAERKKFKNKLLKLEVARR